MTASASFDFPPPGHWPAELGLVVPEYALQTGDLPPFCVITGAPTRRMFPIRRVWGPRWIALLIVAGILPALLFLVLFGDRTAGYLPLHPSVRRKYQLLTAAGVVAFVGGFAATTVGLLNWTPGVAVLGLAAMLGGWIAACRWSRVVSVRRAAPGFVALPKAHPAFVAAFLAGRPPGQVPFSTKPMTFGLPWKWVVGAIALVFLLPALIVPSLAGPSCSVSHLHPGVDAINQERMRNQDEESHIFAGPYGDMTPSIVRSLTAARNRFIANLNAIHVNPSDRAALTRFEAVVRSYDANLADSMQLQGTAARQDVMDVYRLKLNDATNAMNEDLMSLPAHCT